MDGKNKKRVGFGIIIIFILSLLLASWGYWHFKLEPVLLVNKTRYGNMLWLSWAIQEFDTKHGRLPKSLQEMVNDKSLPAEGRIYFSCMKHQSLILKKIPYEQCEFDLRFETNRVVISIPSNVFSEPRFSFMFPEKRSLNVEAGVAQVLVPSDKKNWE